jgi:hypothetical protein
MRPKDIALRTPRRHPVISRWSRLSLLKAPDPVARLLGRHVLRGLDPAMLIPPGLLARLRPELSPRELERVRSELAAVAMRTQIVNSFLRHGEWQAARSHLEMDGFERLGSGPAILLQFHLGAPVYVAYATRLAGHQTRSVTRGWPDSDPSELLVLPSEANAMAHARFIVAALAHLRAGGKIIMLADGSRGSGGHPLRVLGNDPSMRGGAALIAHKLRIPIHPTSAVWDRGKILVTIDHALELPYGAPRETFSRALASTLGPWVDRLIEQHPLSLTHPFLIWLSESNGQAVSDTVT